MSMHIASPADAVRMPPRLRVVPPAPPAGTSAALDALRSAGTIDARQRAAGVAYAALRRRHDTVKHGDGGVSSERWAALKRDHAALIAAAGFDRFLLDRLCLEGEAPLRCEVERVKAALGRLCGERPGVPRIPCAAC